MIVVVAIPSKEEHVWDISSEKVPHMTILAMDDSLGNQDNVVQYIAHAVETSLWRFGASVERRGVLGPDQADALFFDKRGMKHVSEFRSYLLKDQDIFKAYNSIDQYPQWTPHLTLGYPATPAKKETRDYLISWIQFDRIALWTGDSTGPEFMLSDVYNDDVPALAYMDAGFSFLRHLGIGNEDFDLEATYGDFLDLLESELSGANLEHHGVKGMQWGVHKDRPALTGLGPDSVTRETSSGEKITLLKKPPSAMNKFIARVSKTQRELYQNQAYLTIHDSAGKKIGDASLAKRNNDELNLEWLGIHKDSRGKGYATAVMKAGAEFGRKSGFKKLTLEVPGDSPDARHIYEKLGFKEVGQVSGEGDFWGGLTKMEYTIDQSAKHMDTGYDYLEHFGVKGMKWGVRINRNDVSRRVKDLKAATQIRKDPTKSANQARAAQAGGLHKINDKELQAMLKRMEMEKKFSTFMEEDRKRREEGFKAAGKILGEIGRVVLPIALGVAANRVMARRSNSFHTQAFVTRKVIEG